LLNLSADGRPRVQGYYIYILASRIGGTLYIGVTNDLIRRVWEHKNKLVPGFTRKYDVTRLVHFETFHDVRNAIAREKQLKKWRREWKVQLIEESNPNWVDLYPALVGGAGE
jgi:putative endonuclease